LSRVGWAKGEEKLSVVCIKGRSGKGEMRVLRGVVYMMKSRGLRARTVYEEIIIIMCFELSIQIINGIL